MIRIIIAHRAIKQLEKVPWHITLKLKVWINAVKTTGIYQVRKLRGFHDEPLKGKRAGQRSIRLSKAYRAIYTQSATGAVEIVTIEEVTKHDY